MQEVWDLGTISSLIIIVIEATPIYWAPACQALYEPDLI